MNLSSTIERYLYSMHHDRPRPSTAHVRRRQFGLQHLENTLTPERDALLITNRQIEDAFHRIKKRDGTPPAAASLHGYRESWLSFFKWTTLKGYTQALSPQLPKYSYRSTRDKTIPDHIMELVDTNLMRYASRKPNRLRDALMISLIADSGARTGEIYNLLKIDMQHSLKRPFQDVISLGHEGILVTSYSIPSTGKTGNVTLTFSDTSAQLAERFLKRIPQSIYKKSPYLFINFKTGERLHPDSMQTGFERFFKWLGTPIYYGHAFRHRKVTSLDDQGVNASTIAAITGHKSEQMISDHYLNQRHRKGRIANAHDFITRKARADGAHLLRTFFKNID